MSVSACLIVRDEEKTLADCLKSLKHAVDEIIVVDTGSQDETPQIAFDYGAKVYYYKWHDDFSAARNYSLGFANKDWILTIDADERLLTPEAVRIVTQENDFNLAGYYVHVIADDSLLYRTPRLFRNRSDIKYTGLVHEMPPVDVGNWRLSDIQFRHVGYTQGIMYSKQKHARNERLIRKQLELTPDDPIYLFSLGNILSEQKRDEEAEQLLVKTLEIWRQQGCPRDSYIAGCFLSLAKVYNRSNKIQNAINLLVEAGDYFDEPEILIMFGELLLASHKPRQAIQYFFAARDIAQCMTRGEILYGVLDPAYATYKTDELIGLAFYHMHALEPALFHLNRAKNSRPTVNPMAEELIRRCSLKEASIGSA